MIYPLDVYSNIKRSGSVTGKEKGRIILLLFAIADAAIYFGIRTIFNMYIPGFLWLGNLVFVLLNLTVGVLFFRFVVFKENDLVDEYLNSEKDSFSRYFRIRKEVGYEVEVLGEVGYCFEYEDGSIMAVLELRYGSNSNVKFKEGYKCLIELLRLANFYGCNPEVVVMPEDFSVSKESRDYIEQLNNIKDKKLQYTLKNVYHEALEISRKEGNVEIVYITLHAKGQLAKMEFSSVLGAILGVFEEKNHCFRQISLLDKNGIKEFYRQFYNLEILDLSMLQAFDEERMKNTDIVLCQLVGQSGKVYSTINDLKPPTVVSGREL